nr:radical SAM protein [Acidobacteriota bacterium]
MSRLYSIGSTPPRPAAPTASAMRGFALPRPESQDPGRDVTVARERRENRLVDAFGRRLTYLRVSVTDRCNLRCTYCLPEDADLPAADGAFLAPEEIEILVGTLVRLGIERVRLTGGEPLVRKDILEIVRRVRALPGVRNLALSTNGTELERLAAPLRAAGLDRINVSIDSLDPERFHALTRRGDLARVWRGVEAALAVGLAPVKLNAVLLAETDPADLDRLVELTLDRPLNVRFIEMMPTATNRHLQPGQFVSADAVRQRIEARYGPLLPDPAEDAGSRTGPAKAFRIAGARGAL